MLDKKNDKTVYMIWTILHRNAIAFSNKENKQEICMIECYLKLTKYLKQQFIKYLNYTDECSNKS